MFKFHSFLFIPLNIRQTSIVHTPKVMNIQKLTAQSTLMQQKYTSKIINITQTNTKN